MNKTCTKCDETKALDEFHANRRSKDKHDAVCKACRKVLNRQFREKNPTYSRDYRRKIRALAIEAGYKPNKYVRKDDPEFNS